MQSGSPHAGAQGFAALSLVPALHQATIEAGYREPTPLQSQAIPAILAGRDVLACAQTGAGRTAAFVLPILHTLLARRRNGRPAIRALVVASTHERAIQIEACFRRFAAGSGLRVCAASGAADRSAQTEALRRGVEVLVATPTRLFDMLCQSEVDLGLARHFVLDEAGRVLDPGFLDGVRRISTAIPTERQTLLFSTRLPSEVRALADELLRDPVLVIGPEPAAAGAAVSLGADEERPRVRATERLTRSQQSRRNPRKQAETSVRSRSAKPPDNAGTANRDR